MRRTTLARRALEATSEAQYCSCYLAYGGWLLLAAP